MGFTEDLVPKFHSPLTAELRLFTQMQSCPAGVVTCKGRGGEECNFPPVLPVHPRPTPSLWVGCVQGKPKDEHWRKRSYLCFFFQDSHTCSHSATVTLVFPGLSCLSQLNFKKPRKVRDLVTGSRDTEPSDMRAPVQFQLMPLQRLKISDSSCLIFFCFKFTLYPAGISRKA